MKKVLRPGNYSAIEAGKFSRLHDQLKLLTWLKNIKVKESRTY